MKRITIVKIHLCLAFVFLPFMFLMPLSGGLHLLGLDADAVKTPAFEITEQIPEGPAEQEAFFRAVFKKQGIDFDWEMIRSNGKDFTFRPTSRDHYQASKTETGAKFTFVEVPLTKRILEIHMGHGPKMMKWLEIAFAFGLILAALTGVYLSTTVAVYRKLMLASLGVGILLIVAAML